MASNSIMRAADVLKSLNQGASRIVDISKELNLGKSTVHRLLKSLERAGFVAQDDNTRQYYLGYLVISLASNPMIANKNLVMVSLPEMEHLRDKVGETVALQIQVGMHRLFLEEVPSKHLVKTTVGRGSVGSLIEGSGGMVLLSELSDDELRVIFKSINFNTIPADLPKNIEEFFKMVEITRLRGYAVHSNPAVGSTAISVPIKYYAHPVALTVLGPSSRFADITGIFPELKKSADRISMRLKEFTEGLVMKPSTRRKGGLTNNTNITSNSATMK